MSRSPLRRPAALLGLAIVFVVFSGAVCSDNDERIATTGTVQYQNLEGGFWGIVADDGTKYDPINLAEEFQQEDLRVSFRAKPRRDMFSHHMWGSLIEITEMRPIGSQFQ